jgi:type IV fimbrial biogenesis protein FimT
MEGFSLVELMMVICVLALISAIATPSLLNWRSNAKLRGATSNLKGDMELARLKAIQVNDTVVINFTTNRYKVFKDDGPTPGVYDAGEDLYGDRTLPAGVKIDLAKTTFVGESARFKGRGTALAGSAVLVNVNKTEKKVTVSSLGRITITSND